MGMKDFILLLPLLLGSTGALQCDIPGECTGELIGFTSQNSSVECLASCKGNIINKLKVN